MISDGGFDVKSQWNEDGYWGKIDAIAIIVARFYIIMFIISIVVSILALFSINKMVKTVEKRNA
jgi:hypothetical protein